MEPCLPLPAVLPGQAAANDYDSFAEAYSAANEVSLLNAYYERPATLALAGDVAGRRILDAGCGSGPLFAALRDRGAIVTGIDKSAGMSFRKPSPRPSPSRRPSPPEPRGASLSASPVQDEPLRGVKAGRVAVLPSGVAFTGLHAGRSDGSPVAYAPEAEMTCLCGYAEQPGVIGVVRSPRWHARPEPGDGHCGFYAWKPGQPFPWTAGTWLLEVDLYGRVIEHERGYRAQKQRVLRISPVPDPFCEPPFTLSYRPGDGRVTATCAACPSSQASHPVSVDRLRRLLNVEVDLERAWRLREDAARP